MKRWIATLGALLLVPTLASAQGDLVPISELQAQVEEMGRWTQTYQVNGRTIDVDIPIIVPEVEDIPILKAQIIQPMTQERMEQSGGAIRVKEKRDTFAMIEDQVMLTALGQNPGAIEYGLDDGCGDITLVYDQSPIIQRNAQKL